MKKHLCFAGLCLCAVFYTAFADSEISPGFSGVLSSARASASASGWGGVPDAKPPQEEEAYPVKPFRFDPIPDIWMGERGEKTLNYFLFGLIAADGWDLRGMGTSPIGISNYRNVNGFQLGGIYATTVGNVRGVQLAGIFNLSSGGIDGAQITGIVNWAKGSLNGVQMGVVNLSGKGGTGVQIGLVNISANSGSIPIGLVNIVDGGILNPSLWLDSMGFMNLSLKSGSGYFYSHLSAGNRGIPLGSTRLAIMGHNDKNLFVSRIGLGGEIPQGSLFFDIETLCGIIMETSAHDDKRGNVLLLEGRLLGGYKFLSHLALFAGISYDCLLAPDGSSALPGGGITLGEGGGGGGDDKIVHRIGFFGGVQF
jgi:hypothetical protein